MENHKHYIIKNNQVINIVNIDPSDNELKELIKGDADFICSELEYGDVYMNSIWNAENQKFYPPKPYNSWIWSEELDNWIAPIPMPNLLEGNWVWDEESLSYKDLTPQPAQPIIILD